MAVAKLQRLVRIRTVAQVDANLTDPAPFEEFNQAFTECFPLLTQHLTLTEIAPHGMLWHWQGTNQAADPVVLMAHIDVVPVQEEDPWSHDAWGGEVIDGAVWGRGTLDDKGSLVAIAEAVELLLAEGFVPARDIYLSFSSDEEVSGTAAPNAVAHLKQQGVAPWFVLDEGGAVAADAFPGVSAPLAVVGTTEKGTTTLELTVKGRGGHASMPRKMEPAARLARAILRVDDSPFPTRIPDPTLELFRRITPHAPWALKPVLANAAKMRAVVARALQAAGPETNAMTRTTAVTTTLRGAPAHNVIPTSASAAVNIRILVGDTVESVLSHVTKAVNDDQVSISVHDANEPSPVSPVDDSAFRLLEQCVEQVFPDAVATPYVVMGATDARHFHAICPRVYRFTPFRMSKPQRASLHSYDEHLGVEDFTAGIRWYRHLIERIPS